LVRRRRPDALRHVRAACRRIKLDLWTIQAGDTNRWLLGMGRQAELFGPNRTSFLATNSSDPFNYRFGYFTGIEF
jgi:hypothetical protein